MSDFPQGATRKERVSLETQIYRWLGQYDGFYTHPPLSDRKLYSHDGQEVVALKNDGFEVWIGSINHWHWHTKNAEFRKIALWFLYQWAIVNWFGLRSWLWYKLLNRRIKENIP